MLPPSPAGSRRQPVASCRLAPLGTRRTCRSRLLLTLGMAGRTGRLSANAHADPDTPVPSTVAARPRSSVLDRRRQPKAGHVMADEPILDAGYALFFDALLNEPLLDLELVLA